MTNTTTATELEGVILPELDTMLAALEGQVLVSQNRWIDNLLDLYNLCPNRDLQRVIEGTLREIRNLNSVDAGYIRQELLTLAGAVAVESAFDTTAALIH